MPIAIPDDTCRARVHEILVELGVSVSAITPDAEHWIALSCALSIPPALVSALYCKLAQWVTLAETCNLESLPRSVVESAKADFFMGKVAFDDTGDLFRRLLANQRAASTTPRSSAMSNNA